MYLRRRKITPTLGRMLRFKPINKDFTPSFQNAQVQASIIKTDSESLREIYQKPGDSSQETNIKSLVSSGGSLGSDNSLEDNLKSSYKTGRRNQVVN